MIDKTLLNYLTRVLEDDRKSIEQSVFETILANSEQFNPDIYGILVSYWNHGISDSLLDTNPFKTERAVKNLLAVAEQIYTMHNDKAWAGKILDGLLHYEAIIHRYYLPIAEFYAKVLNEPQNVRRTFEFAEREIRKEITLYSKIYWRFENEPEEKSEPNIFIYIKLAKNVAELTGDMEWVKRICNEAYPMVISESDLYDLTIDLAEMFIRYFGKDDADARGKAVALFQKAYAEVLYVQELVRFTGEVIIILHDLDWGKRLLLETEGKIEKPEDWCVLAETVFIKDGFDNPELAKDYYRKAIEASKDQDDIQWCIDSIEDTFGLDAIFTNEIKAEYSRWKH